MGRRETWTTWQAGLAKAARGRRPIACHRRHALTEATVDDATTAITLIGAIHSDVASVTADTAYDTIAFYDTASARGASVVVPPAKTATVSRHDRGPRRVIAPSRR